MLNPGFLTKSLCQFIEEGSCSFYRAPIVIIVMIDKVFPKIRYLDIGLCVSYLLLAAHAKGLATCPIGLINAYSDDIADGLNPMFDSHRLTKVDILNNNRK